MSNIGNLAQIGLVIDPPSVILPPNAFSDGRNVRFRNNSVEAISGEVTELEDETIGLSYGLHWRTPQPRSSAEFQAQGGFNVYFEKPDEGFPDDTDGTTRLLMAGPQGLQWEVEYANNDTRVSGVSGNSAYRALTPRWDHTVSNGGFFLVVTNGKKTPSFIQPGATLGDPPVIAPLPGWDYLGASGSFVSTRLIRQFKYCLVAANLEVRDAAGNVERYPSTIRISDQAAPGALPQSWEPGLTSDTADEFELATTSPITNMLELRGLMFVYTFDSVHVLQLDNNGNVSRQQYSSSYGCINSKCVVEANGYHYVVDRNDVYRHSGQGAPESVMEGRVKDYFLSNLDREAEDKVFMMLNRRMQEIWVCFPKTGSPSCNEALVFNYVNNTWSIRDLPLVPHGFPAPAGGPDNVFNYLDERPNLLQEKRRLPSNKVMPSVVRADTGSRMWDGDEYVPIPSYLVKSKIFFGEALQSFAISGMSFLMDRVGTGGLAEVVLLTQNDWVRTPDFTQLEASDIRQIDPANPESFQVVARDSGRCVSFRLQSRDPWRLAMISLIPAQRGMR